MVRVNLKGIAKVTAKGRTYWYAWRGGPRLRGEPGSRRVHRLLPRGSREPAGARYQPLPLPGDAVQGERRIREARRHRPSAIGRPGSTASATISAICTSPSSIARRRSGRSSGNGATTGPTSRAPPTMACRFSPASCPMPSIRSARSPAIHARASSSSTAATARRSSGPTPTSPSSRDVLRGDRARRRSCRAYRPAAWRPAAALVVACRRGRHHHRDRQEQASPRGDHSAL